MRMAVHHHVRSKAQASKQASKPRSMLKEGRHWDSTTATVQWCVERRQLPVPMQFLGPAPAQQRLRSAADMEMHMGSPTDNLPSGPCTSDKQCASKHVRPGPCQLQEAVT